MATNDETNAKRCSVCDGDDLVRWSCIQCDNKMCDNCKNAHLKSKQSCNHSVFTMSGQDQQDPEICGFHPREKLSLFCKECDNLACNKCVSESHRAHQISKVCEIAQEKRKDFLKYITKLKEILMSQTSLNQTLNKQEENYVEEVAKAIEDIRKRGEELKSEIDYITSIFVEKLRTLSEENLEPLRKTVIDLDARIKDLKSIIEQRENEYKSLSDVLIVKSSGNILKEYTSTSREPIALKDPPKFKIGEKKYDILSVLFGEIDTESDHEKSSDCIDNEISYCPNIDKSIISSFKLGRPASCVSCLGDSKSWFGYRSNSKEILLAAQDGLRIKTITFDCCPKDVAATPKAELLISDNEGKTIRRISRGGKILNVINTAPYQPQGVFATQEDLLVCLYQYGEPGKVSRFSLSGTPLSTLQYDSNDKSPLFKNPCFVAQNINGDICVIDRNEILIVVDKDGRFHFRYGDKREMKLKSYGITCDSYANILISDQNSDAIIVINKRGEYIQSIEKGVSYPWGICVAKSGQLWICNSGGHVLIVKYLA